MNANEQDQLISDWVLFCDDSIVAIAQFKTALQVWRQNDNHERHAGEFNAVYRRLVDVLGHGWLDRPGLDELHDLVTGELTSECEPGEATK